MIYLIYTTIIFEIIIAIMAVVAIIKFDTKINEINVCILENRYKIREAVRAIRKEINQIFIIIKNFGEKITRKRNSFFFDILKKLIISTSLRIFLKKYKKQIVYAELVLIVYETIQNCIKA